MAINNPFFRVQLYRAITIILEELLQKESENFEVLTEDLGFTEYTEEAYREMDDLEVSLIYVASLEEEMEATWQLLEKRNPRTQRWLNRRNRRCNNHESRKHPFKREKLETRRRKEKRLAKSEMVQEAEEYFDETETVSDNLAETLLQEFQKYLDIEEHFFYLLDQISSGDFSKENEAREIAHWVFLGEKDLESAIREGRCVESEVVYDSIIEERHEGDTSA